MACSMSQDVSAHSRLVDPPSRSEDDFLMEGPCGAVAAGADRTVFEAGQTTVLRWELTQNHNAQFRVAFSPGGDEGFDDWVLGMRPDVTGELSYDQELELPECVCDTCSLQLLQYSSMTMLAGYYSCADIELTQPEGGRLPACAGSEGEDSTSGSGLDTGTAGEAPSESGSEPAPSTTTTGAAATESSGAGQQDAGGCRVAPSRSASPVWLAFALVGLRRRRPW